MTRFIIALALACVACDESDTEEAQVPVEECTRLCNALDNCDIAWRFDDIEYDGKCEDACLGAFFDRPCYWACGFYPLHFADCDYIEDVLLWCGSLFPDYSVFAVEVCR